MTTLLVIDGRAGETRSQAIARRLKGALAERDLSMSEVARRLGVTQQKLSRRMTGLNSFDIDELDLICELTGVDFNYITTGIRPIPDPPPPSIAPPRPPSRKPTDSEPPPQPPSPTRLFKRAG